MVYSGAMNAFPVADERQSEEEHGSIKKALIYALAKKI
jgi:hypothetical protein